MVMEDSCSLAGHSLREVLGVDLEFSYSGNGVL